MPTELISIGPPTTLLQNVVYALPASRCLLFCDTAATLQQSNTLAFTNNVALTFVDGQSEVAGGFIRSTAGNAVVTLKKA